LSLNFPGVSGSELLALCPELCASTGSACHSGTTRLSPTLAAMGVPAKVGAGCVRLSAGWFTDEAEIGRAAEMLIAAWHRLQSRRGSDPAPS
jgi:cysteine desulfurase